MKKVALTSFLLVVMAATSSLFADIITLNDVTTFTATGTNAPEDYVDHGWGDVNFLNGAFDYVIWTHQFEFVPPAEEILTADLTLDIYDDGGWFDSWETALIIPEGWTGSDLELDVNSDSYDFNVNLQSLEDGFFSVGVASLWGDFYIDRSELSITYTAASVPEPATLSLLGFGLLALGFISRRKKS